MYPINKVYFINPDCFIAQLRAQTITRKYSGITVLTHPFRSWEPVFVLSEISGCGVAAAHGCVFRMSSAKPFPLKNASPALGLRMTTGETGRPIHTLATRSYSHRRSLGPAADENPRVTISVYQLCPALMKSRPVSCSESAARLRRRWARLSPRIC